MALSPRDAQARDVLREALDVLGKAVEAGGALWPVVPAPVLSPSATLIESAVSAPGARPPITESRRALGVPPSTYEAWVSAWRRLTASADWQGDASAFPLGPGFGALEYPTVARDLPMLGTTLPLFQALLTTIEAPGWIPPVNALAVVASIVGVAGVTATVVRLLRDNM